MNVRKIGVSIILIIFVSLIVSELKLGPNCLGDFTFLVMAGLVGICTIMAILIAGGYANDLKCVEPDRDMLFYTVSLIVMFTLVTITAGIMISSISDDYLQEISDNTFNETITVTGKTISIENRYNSLYAIDSDKGTFKAQWEDYSSLIVGKKYDVAIYRGTIRTVFGEVVA